MKKIFTKTIVLSILVVMLMGLTLVSFAEEACCNNPSWTITSESENVYYNHDGHQDLMITGYDIKHCTQCGAQAWKKQTAFLRICL